MNREEAIEFLVSDWFENFCDGISMPKDRVMFLILNGKVSSRTTYE